MPKATTARYDDEDEPERCRAYSRSTNGRCGNKKLPGYQVCRLHGARGGRPITTGRYSERLGRVRDMYERALESNDGLIDLRETLALLDVNVQRAADRVAENDTPDFRRRAIELFDEARKATDRDTQQARLTELGRLLHQGGGEDDAFEQLTSAAERLAIRQEKAWGIRLNAAQALNARDLVVVMARLVDIIIEEAPDRASRIVGRIDAEIMGGSEVAPRVLDQS